MSAVLEDADAHAQRVHVAESSGRPVESGAYAVYFAEWQFATDEGMEYLDPVGSQYKEAIFLVSGTFEGETVAYCPFIWVDQDIALMRGLVQGWPKQVGSVWLSRAFDLPSKASPVLGASLAVRDRRLVDATVKLTERTDTPPSPGFAKAFNVRYFPDLAKGRHDQPAVHELVRLKSRDVQFSPIWKGDASLTFHDHPSLELAELPPSRVIAGYRFSFAFTVDDLVHVRDLRGISHTATAST